MSNIMKLVKIFDEYDNIVLRGKSFFSKYDAYYKLERKKNAVVDLQKIEEYVKRLQQKYPKEDFQLKIRKIAGKQFYVITKKSYRMQDGRKIIVRDRVPIYIDLENQEFYVPKSYILNRRKLANYIIFRTLGSLGVAKVRYLSMGGRS
uniref:Uncharacterized protein n=1 Tax=Ignisphaera aggregans TaxID=334771 RepID=A0A7J3JQ66_9CREN